MRALRLIRLALGLGLAVSAAHGQSVYWADDFVPCGEAPIGMPSGIGRPATR